MFVGNGCLKKKGGLEARRTRYSRHLEGTLGNRFWQNVMSRFAAYSAAV